MSLLDRLKKHEDKDDIDYVAVGDPTNDVVGYTISTSSFDPEDSDYDDDDTVYRITPKGIAAYYLNMIGMADGVCDPRIDAFWTLFDAAMRENKYVVEG